MISNRWSQGWAGLVGAALSASICQSAVAATLCVNPGSKSGCSATIAGAVAAATPGDTIQVAPGTYAEGDIKIGKPLSLIGANSANTIINATGKGNGIYIDGLDNTGLSEGVVGRDLPSKTPISKASLSPMLPRSRFRTTAWSATTWR